MTFKLIVLFFTSIVISSCLGQTESKKTSISGKLFSSAGKTVYLNKIDHFDYLNDKFTIDSTTVSENGEFRFDGQNLDSQLVSLTTEKFKPYTYQIFSAAPQTYYFGNCEKFFTSIPTFYVTDEESIDINWHETQSIDSISSPNNSGLAQIQLREFYLNSKKIDASNLNYDNKQDFEENWEQMLIEKDFDLKKVNFENIKLEKSFDNYLYTEIYLGHLNQFLNWFEEHFPGDVKTSIQNPKLENFYSNIFTEYKRHKWNSKSLEYYKFTERYVNHYMNIQTKSFEHYYKPSDKKRELAAMVLDGKNKERYLTLVDKQLKNVL